MPFLSSASPLPSLFSSSFSPRHLFFTFSSSFSFSIFSLSPSFILHLSTFISHPISISPSSFFLFHFFKFYFIPFSLSFPFVFNCFQLFSFLSYTSLFVSLSFSYLFDASPLPISSSPLLIRAQGESVSSGTPHWPSGRSVSSVHLLRPVQEIQNTSRTGEYCNVQCSTYVWRRMCLYIREYTEHIATDITFCA